MIELLLAISLLFSTVQTVRMERLQATTAAERAGCLQLQSAVVTQNEAIQALAAEKDRIQAASATAQLQAAEALADAEARAAGLESMQAPASCQAAIELLVKDAAK